MAILGIAALQTPALAADASTMSCVDALPEATKSAIGDAAVAGITSAYIEPTDDLLALADLVASCGDKHSWSDEARKIAFDRARLLAEATAYEKALLSDGVPANEGTDIWYALPAPVRNSFETGTPSKEAVDALSASLTERGYGKTSIKRVRMMLRYVAAFGKLRGLRQKFAGA
ncbi:hypothetical protein [Erythrobacter sp. CCH5-A1]|jgi:hypothetical protein|uniref:hypothetical protein n=1 Tax=Erythrobacter sp. CCH5-A1 TaxID=1768792 RepID=UPI00083089DD|nr:hypothetical protein [Erythrobacter sp. CCH5-A1]